MIWCEIGELDSRVGRNFGGLVVAGQIGDVDSEIRIYPNWRDRTQPRLPRHVDRSEHGELGSLDHRVGERVQLGEIDGFGLGFHEIVRAIAGGFLFCAELS